MKPDDLRALLEQYRAGLEAELALLEQLHAVAGRQRDVSTRHDYEHLSRENDQRDTLMRSLVALDLELRGVREQLGRLRSTVSKLPDYETVVELRRAAADLVARILATDRDSMKALADADLARRAAVASLERGETTLAAYRKVIAPPVASAALFTRRG